MLMPNNIQIKLQCDAEYIFLIISDNGKGFDPSHYKKGLGLTNIMNRANLFNGKVEIDAAPGQGMFAFRRRSYPCKSVVRRRINLSL